MTKFSTFITDQLVDPPPPIYISKAFLLIVYPFPSSVSSVATVTKLILHPRGAIPHLSASGKGRREEGNQSVYV